MQPKVIPAVITKNLKRGGIGVLPTDTMYGIVGRALNKKTVERIYVLRKRNPKKPMIILIAHVGDVARFGVALDAQTKKILDHVWPGKVSVVLPQSVGNKKLVKKFRYLHRGTRSLAFRLPEPAWLRALLLKTGPLVAPSANFEGRPPARTVKEAKRYFGDKVQFYVDIGRLASKPSTLVAAERGIIRVLRPGAVNIDKL